MNAYSQNLFLLHESNRKLLTNNSRWTYQIGYSLFEFICISVISLTFCYLAASYSPVKEYLPFIARQPKQTNNDLTRVVNGVITAKNDKTDPEGGYYEIVYQYQDDLPGKSMTFTKRQTILYEDFVNFQVGQKIQIAYSPSEPNRSKVIGLTTRKREGGFVLLLLALITVCFIPFAIRNCWRVYKVTKSGILIQGHIIKAEIIKLENGDEIKANYEFFAPDGFQVFNSEVAKLQSTNYTEIVSSQAPDLTTKHTTILVMFLNHKNYYVL